MKKIIIISFIMTAGFVTAAESFLDLEFGKPYAEINTAITSGKIPVQPSTPERIDQYMTSIKYRGNHKLKGAKETTLTFYNDQLTFIRVDFKATDHANLYDALKILLEKKYGQLSPGTIKIAGAECKTIAGDIEITLTRDDDLMNHGGTVTLTAVSIPLAEAWQESLIADKANELGEL